MMAAKFMQPPPPVTRVGGDNAGKLMAVMRADGVYSGRLHLRSKSSIGFGYYSSGFKPIRVSEQRSELLGDEHDDDDEAKMEVSHPRTPTQIKEDLYKALEGINRGIFGVTSGKKLEIEELVNLLESMNPFPEPTKSMDKVAGRWKVVYSTVKILGRKRTKLGMRGFVSLGDILQTVNVPEEKSVDLFKFNMKGMDFLNGHLKIESSFKIASESRVDLKYEKSTVAPDQLLNVFRKKYDTLLSIFNPEGWHEITYLDETLRIGRDDKGNIFVLERYEAPESC